MIPLAKAARLTLAYQETYPDAGEIKPVEPVLDIDIDISCVVTSFPLKHAGRDRGHSRIMPFLDHFEGLGKLLVVVPHLWRPVDARGVGEISSRGKSITKAASRARNKLTAVPSEYAFSGDGSWRYLMNCHLSHRFHSRYHSRWHRSRRSCLVSSNHRKSKPAMGSVWTLAGVAGLQGAQAGILGCLVAVVLEGN